MPATLQLRSERTPDGIVTLWLAQPERSVIVLDQWLLDQLHLFFEWLAAQPPATGFILRSASERSFVAGADIAEIARLDDSGLHAYLTLGAHAFARVSRLACPSVAVVHQTALGGGLELAMHCDGLIAQSPPPGQKPWRVGLPEAGLGLCPGWGGTQMLPARIDPAEAIRAAAGGTTWGIDAPPAGLFDEVIPHGADPHAAAIRYIRANPRVGAPTIPRSIDPGNRDAIAVALSAVRSTLPSTPAAHAVVEAVEVGLAEEWSAAIGAERRLLVALRHTPEAQERIQAFLARSGGSGAGRGDAGTRPRAE
ncbi:MAG TPA: enoyl-CoA hydratase-related protein [Phycisphaerales bacterium]|nr:enoyl-CoA hydratase-related protein [Phycisphaerales bacterium]HMP37212.1 enoyl-CoA hydratase-related protein [Phycisphaerales bacterium]